MNAIMVNNNNGYYEMIGAAEIEDWGNVINAADNIEYLGKLVGWGEYTYAYRVIVYGRELTYFVAATN